MPETCHILITATGHPVIRRGTVILPNVELRRFVTNDWKLGTANYKYVDSKGKWHEIK